MEMEEETTMSERRALSKASPKQAHSVNSEINEIEERGT
jgi:hypothetical protein